MKEIISKKKLKSRVFKSKYLFLERQLEKNKNQELIADLIIAPSWNSGFYKLQCHILLQKFLQKSNITFKFRPHPMSLKKNETSIHSLKAVGINIDADISINFYKISLTIFMKNSCLTKNLKISYI